MLEMLFASAKPLMYFFLHMELFVPSLLRFVVIGSTSCKWFYQYWHLLIAYFICIVSQTCVLKNQSLENIEICDLMHCQGQFITSLEQCCSWIFVVLQDNLTAHNWQNWKKNIPFILLPWNVYGRSSWSKNYNYIWKITTFVNMWNLGQFLEKSIFCQ